MPVQLTQPEVDDLPRVIEALRQWQYEGAPMQLHPGDVGWFWRFGATEVSRAVRTWSDGKQILAAGLLDGPGLVRLTVAPHARRDKKLARQVVDDLTRPERGVLSAGRANVEAPSDAMVHELLAEEGWETDEPWTPLRRDLTAPVPDSGVRIEEVGYENAQTRVDVQRASFDASSFTAARWNAMSMAPTYVDASCLLAFDDRGNAVAAVTVWSAGVGKPGLIEPMGVHRRYRGQRYGRAITLAAAAKLRQLGSSSAIVCTPSANIGAVAAYRSAGMDARTEIHDRYRNR